VVIGYSFPPTDFLTQHLFREAFADHQPEEVTVVNPSASPVRTVGELTHVKPARVRNLESISRLETHRQLPSKQAQGLGIGRPSRLVL
jgi:hypothetical protein